MIMSCRTIWGDNGVLKDISIETDDFKSGSKVLPIVASEDYLYLASDFPFNHRYFDVSSANAVASSVSIDLWDGSSWNPTYDIIDQTAISGVTLSQSGIISFVPSDRSNWVRANTNTETGNGGKPITGLETLYIKGLYWARIKFSVSLTSTTAVSYIGHKFSDDNDLEIYYPDLTRSAVMVQFKAGKTDWKLQHLQAAQDIIKDLKASRIVKSENQLMDWQLFNSAGVHKVAEIAFNAFGKDFYENRDAARALYKAELNQAIYKVDENNNARLDTGEREMTQGILNR